MDASQIRPLASVRKTDRQDVQVTKALCGAECWTDHRLIICKLNLQIQPPRRPQGKMASKCLHLSGLKDKHFRQRFADTLNSRLDSLLLDSDDVEENWIEFRSSTYSSAHAVLGSTKRKHQDWFDENDMQIRKLLDEKHRLHVEYLSDRSSMSKKAAYSIIRRETQSKLRTMKILGWKTKPKRSRSMQIP